MNWGCTPATQVINGSSTVTVDNFPQPPYQVTETPKSTWTTYDSANQGVIKRLAIEPIANTQETAITYSTSGLRRALDDTFTINGSSTAFQTMLTDDSRIVLGSGNDTQYILGPANSTNLSLNVEFIAPISGVVDQIALSLGIGLNMSAFTNGTRTISGVTVTPTTILNKTGSTAGAALLANIQPQPISITPNSAFTALAAAGTSQVLAIRSAFNAQQPFPVYAGQPFVLNIATNITGSGTNTWQTGLVNLWSGVSADTTKIWYTNQAAVSIRSVPENMLSLVPNTTYNLQGVGT